MRCAYLAFILLLALAVCADAGKKKRQPKKVCKTKNGKRKVCRPKPAPPLKPSLPPKPVPPPPAKPPKPSSTPKPSTTPKPELPPKFVPKCSQDQKLMNKWLQKSLQEGIEKSKQHHRAMYFCGLWRVVEIAQDYQLILQGLQFINHKFNRTYTDKMKYVTEFEKDYKNYKKIVQYPPVSIGNITLLPFGCKWEIDRVADNEVNCLFVTSEFVQFMKMLAEPNNPYLEGVSSYLHLLQNM